MKRESRWSGALLRRLREAAGVTQEELARRVRCTRESVARWESDKREPSWSSVVIVAEALGVTVAAFTS